MVVVGAVVVAGMKFCEKLEHEYGQKSSRIEFVDTGQTT